MLDNMVWLLCLGKALARREECRIYTLQVLSNVRRMECPLAFQGGACCTQQPSFQMGPLSVVVSR